VEVVSSGARGKEKEEAGGKEEGERRGRKEGKRKREGMGKRRKERGKMEKKEEKRDKREGKQGCAGGEGKRTKRERDAYQRLALGRVGEQREENKAGVSLHTRNPHTRIVTCPRSYKP
jgi:hypothetical protein